MYKMLISTFILMSFYTYSAEEEEVEYEEDIEIQSSECLQLQDTRRGYGSNHQLRFYNTCPVEVWASICVEERPRQYKLHESGSKIPKYGYINIYSYASGAPLSVEWRSSAGKPAAPGHCGN